MYVFPAPARPALAPDDGDVADGLAADELLLPSCTCVKMYLAPAALDDADDAVDPALDAPLVDLPSQLLTQPVAVTLAPAPLERSDGGWVGDDVGD